MGVCPIARLGEMVEEEIQSTYLNEAMVLKIYKPAAFSELYKYNLCIMQDGNDYYQIGRIAPLSDELHRSEEISRTIFIGIHYVDKYDRRKKYHPDGEQQQAYIKFLKHEVIALLDETLPTYHMGQSRILLGDSLAGTIALQTAIQYPHTFGKVILQSPYVDQTVLDAVKNAPPMHALDVYHTIGENETGVNVTDGSTVDFLTPNRALHELLIKQGAQCQYYELAGGEHTWKYWQKDLRHAITSTFE